MSHLPRSAVMSYRFWPAACLTGVITAAVTLLGFDQLQGTLLTIVEREFPNELPAPRDELVTVALAVLIYFGVIVALLQLMVSLSMRAGRRAARAVLVVLAVIGASYAAIVYPVVPFATQIGLLVTIALTVLATALMFCVRPGRWFTGKQVKQYDVYE